MAPSMREPTYFILLAMAEGARHGYAITSTARELSAGRVRLAAGTLYGALDRLAADGLVEPDGEEVVEGRKRRYYRLTELGRGRLREEVEHLEAKLAASRKVLSAPGSTRVAGRAS